MIRFLTGVFLFSAFFFFGGFVKADPLDSLWFENVRKSTVYVTDESTGETCLGVLVSKRTVVTAAHCGDWYRIFPQRATIVSRDQKVKMTGIIEVHPEAKQFQGDSSQGEKLLDPSRDLNDIALVHLDKDVRDFDSMAIATIDSKPVYSKDSLLLVGFVKSDEDSYKGGFPEAIVEGFDELAETNTATFTIKGAVCHGHSGSGVFRERDHKLFLVGILKYGDVGRGDLQINGEKCGAWGAATLIRPYFSFVGFH